jgi:hypothetical protein
MKRVYKFGFSDRIPNILRKLGSNPFFSKKFIIKLKKQNDIYNKNRRKLQGSLISRSDIFKTLHHFLVKNYLKFLPKATLMWINDNISVLNYHTLAETLKFLSPAQLRDLVLPNFFKLLADFLKRKGLIN